MAHSFFCKTDPAIPLNLFICHFSVLRVEMFLDGMRFIGASYSVCKLYHKYNDSQKKVCYDTDINNKGQKSEEKSRKGKEP